VQIHGGAGDASASIRTPDGRWVLLHSERAPSREADRWLDGALSGALPSLVIAIGPGLGYILEAIERRGAATRVIAIEPFAAVARAMFERRDWRDWVQSRRLTILIGPEYLEASDAWRRVNIRADPPPIIEHPVLAREFPAEIARARDVAARIVQGARSNDDARKKFAGRYLLNTLTNLPSIVAEGDVAALADMCTGKPAIVVGAGPSLDDNLEQLRANAGRALIVAVDTALRPLLAAGITPNLVVALDPSELNATHLLDADAAGHSWLVSEGSLDPRVLPQFAGRAFIFKISDHHPWPWLRAHGCDRGTLRAWGSVLTTAFDLACHAGCNPIMFAGADLAYTNELLYCRNTIFEGERSHLTGVAERAAAFRDGLRQRETCAASDIHGRPVLTTPLLVQFRDWLVSRSAEVGDRRIVNATGAGILHGGRIVQSNLASLALGDGVVDLGARLTTLWTESSRNLPMPSTLEDALIEPDGNGIPLETWLDFAGDTASSEQIVASTEPGWRAAPVITAHPANVFWEPGCPASFTASSSGGPKPAVQWQASADGGGSWANIAGATGSTHVVTIAATDGGKQFRAVFTNRHGSATTTAAAIAAGVSGVVYDFNGDGQPDILWRNPITGANVVWYLRGIAQTGSDVLPEVPDLGWVLGGAGDFNGDGKPGIVWRHSMLGENVVWHVDGTRLASHGVLPSDADLAWTIVGVGDFNGDGKPDILWRHSVTGANRIWFMDGISKTGSGELDAEPDVAWSIVGVGDFNGDGKPDILWRNSETGANRVWYMDGVTRAGLGVLDTEADLTWTVLGTGDFNGDGKPDILWHNAVTGAYVVSYMDGVMRAGQVRLDVADGFR
jgi:hypothetical protein